MERAKGFEPSTPNLGNVPGRFTLEHLSLSWSHLSHYSIKFYVVPDHLCRILHRPSDFRSRASPASPAAAGTSGEANSGTIEQEPIKAKIIKRTVEALEPEPDRDVFAWDSELRGFGVRVKPSGVTTFLIQYRNAEGRARRLVFGQYGALTPEAARDSPRKKLTAVAEGEDPSADRHAVRAGISVSQVCDWYLEQAEVGCILGRNRRPSKASTLHMDRSRIETHLKAVARFAPRERPHFACHRGYAGRHSRREISPWPEERTWWPLDRGDRCG